MPADRLSFKDEDSAPGFERRSIKPDADSSQQSLDLYKFLAEFISDVIWVYNLSKERFTFISSAVEALLGYSVEEAISLNVKQLLDMDNFQYMNNQISQWFDNFGRQGKSTVNPYIELQIKQKSGELVWCELSGRFRHNELRQIELIGTARNIETRKRNEKRIIYLSYHDQLTTLYNRHFYVAELRRLDVERNLPISLIVSDVNGLKATNDIFGHTAGDRLLVTYADVLQSACRADDIVARIGGDEFVVLLPQTDADHANKILERIREKISQRSLEQSALSVSFGLATKTHPDQLFSDVYKRAEDMMYNQKIIDRPVFERQLLEYIVKDLYENDLVQRAHSRRVSKLCRMLAKALDLTTDDIDDITLAGRLHDIGKIAINRKILDKTESLTEMEWQEIKKHVEIGYKIMCNIKAYQDIAEGVLAHHERPDGHGYPRGLNAKAIPLMARIISIADAYDAMTGKKKIGQEQALAELARCAGDQFDPELVAIFIENIKAGDSV